MSSCPGPRPGRAATARRRRDRSDVARGCAACRAELRRAIGPRGGDTIGGRAVPEVARRHDRAHRCRDDLKSRRARLLRRALGLERRRGARAGHRGGDSRAEHESHRHRHQARRRFPGAERPALPDRRSGKADGDLIGTRDGREDCSSGFSSPFWGGGRAKAQGSWRGPRREAGPGGAAPTFRFAAASPRGGGEARLCKSWGRNEAICDTAFRNGCARGLLR